MEPETAVRVMIQRQKLYQGPEQRAINKGPGIAACITSAQEQQHYKGPGTAALQGLKNSGNTRTQKQQQYKVSKATGVQRLKNTSSTFKGSKIAAVQV
jgi:hypothetical protein